MSLNEKWFKPYEQILQNINIINVSTISKINIFPKMDYPEFLKQIGTGFVNQQEVRQEIKSIINEKTKIENS